MHIISGNAEEHRGDLHSPGVEGAPQHQDKVPFHQSYLYQLLRLTVGGWGGGVGGSKYKMSESVPRLW